jgi:hypothetical protein
MFAANATAQQQGGYRYWRLIASGSSGGYNALSEWRVTTSDASISSLAGKTVTNLGAAFDGAYVMANLTDGVAETSNAANLAAVVAPSAMDVYVDLGAAKVVTAYGLAPQGGGAYTANNPTSVTVQASNDATNWTTVATFTGITVGYPNWSPGVYRTFSW